MVNYEILGAVLFYLLVIIIIYINRKKFIIQSHIIALYKTKIGLKMMGILANPLSERYDKFGKFLYDLTFGLIFLDVLLFASSKLFAIFGFDILKYVFLLNLYTFLNQWMFLIFTVFLIAVIGFRQFSHASTTGIWTGFIGMLFITYSLVQNAYDLIMVDGTKSAVAPVLPGFKVAGLGITVPLFYGILSIFLIATIHEFSHGIISRLKKVPVHWSGIVFFGPIIGAFVEPDEKKLVKRSVKDQLAIFAAGPFSNILLAAFVFFILTAIISPFLTSIAIPSGLGITSVTTGMAGEVFKVGEIIKSVNGVSTLTVEEFATQMDKFKVGDTVSIATDKKSYDVTLTGDKLGINIQAIKQYDEKFVSEHGILFFLLQQLSEFLWWLMVLSLGIGLANLLPLGPVDGGRMLKVVLEKYVEKTKAVLLFTYVSSFILLILLFDLLYPYVHNFF